MTCNIVEQSEFLDENNEDSLLTRVQFSKDFNKIINFTVVYITSIGGKPTEITKYDFSEKESLHVHYYYNKPPTKQFIQFDNYDSPEEIFKEMNKHIDYIKTNFRKLKLKYKE